MNIAQSLLQRSARNEENARRIWLDYCEEVGEQTRNKPARNIDEKQLLKRAIRKALIEMQWGTIIPIEDGYALGDYCQKRTNCNGIVWYDTIYISHYNKEPFVGYIIVGGRYNYDNSFGWLVYGIKVDGTLQLWQS